MDLRNIEQSFVGRLPSSSDESPGSTTKLYHTKTPCPAILDRRAFTNRPTFCSCSQCFSGAVPSVHSSVEAKFRRRRVLGKGRLLMSWFMNRTQVYTFSVHIFSRYPSL